MLGKLDFRFWNFVDELEALSDDLIRVGSRYDPKTVHLRVIDPRYRYESLLAFLRRCWLSLHWCQLRDFTDVIHSMEDSIESVAEKLHRQTEVAL